MVSQEHHCWRCDRPTQQQFLELEEARDFAERCEIVIDAPAGWRISVFRCSECKSLNVLLSTSLLEAHAAFQSLAYLSSMAR